MKHENDFLYSQRLLKKSFISFISTMHNEYTSILKEKITFDFKLQSTHLVLHVFEIKVNF